MKKLLLWLIIVVFVVQPLHYIRAAHEAVLFDSLIKGGSSAIYYYPVDGNRYAFPNKLTFSSWFKDFSKIITITDEQLADIPLKGNITYRPGVWMVKLQTSPKVYVVAQGGVLRWIQTEELAATLYGFDWTQKINDIPDVFFLNYEVGTPLERATDYDPSTVLSRANTINKDRGIPESGRAPRAETVVGGSTTPTSTPAIPAAPAQPIPTTTATSTEPLFSDTPTATTTPTSTPAIPAEPATPASSSSTGDSAAPAPVTQDIDPPDILTIEAMSITASSTTIMWTTDEPADTKVIYGLVSPVLANMIGEVSDANQVTSHSIDLTNLTIGTTYYFVVVSTDASGNTATSSDQTFTTLLPPAQQCEGIVC